MGIISNILPFFTSLVQLKFHFLKDVDHLMIKGRKFKKDWCKEYTF